MLVAPKNYFILKINLLIFVDFVNNWIQTLENNDNDSESTVSSSYVDEDKRAIEPFENDDEDAETVASVDVTNFDMKESLMLSALNGVTKFSITNSENINIEQKIFVQSVTVNNVHVSSNGFTTKKQFIEKEVSVHLAPILRLIGQFVIYTDAT